MFGRHRSKQAESYDHNAFTPVIRGSICTGEQVFGFRENATGRFVNGEVIRNDAEKRAYMQRYGINEEDIRKEW